jgi:hypothetical protein
LTDEPVQPTTPFEPEPPSVNSPPAVEIASSSWPAAGEKWTSM